MNLMKAPRVLLALTLVLFAYQMFPGAAAETQPDLQCDVTRRPDGSTVYRVSEPRGSQRCTREWLDQNNTVIARNSDPDPARALNVTDTSITLKVCEDFLYHIRDCQESFEEANCTVDCSRLMVESQRRTVNSTLICISESFCLQQQTWIIIISVISVVSGIILLVVGVFVIRHIWKRRKQESAMQVEYSAATGVIKV